jgi:hypothetical protein
LLRSNGAIKLNSIYKHVAPNGAKRVNCSRTLDVEIERNGEIDPGRKPGEPSLRSYKLRARVAALPAGDRNWLRPR